MNEIFRFMVLRPPQTPDPRVSKPIRIESDQSDYQSEVKKGRSEDDGAKRVREATDRFLESPDYVKDLRSVGLPLLEFADQFATQKPNGLQAVSALVQSTFGKGAKDVVSDAAFSRAFTNIGDSAMALILAGRENEEHYDHLVCALRLCALIERAANQDTSLNRPRAIERALNEAVVLPRAVLPVPIPSDVQATPTAADVTERSEKARMRAAIDGLSNLKVAIDEVSTLKASDFGMAPPEVLAPPRSTQTARTDETAVGPQASGLAPQNSWVLSTGVFATLSDTTRNEITTLGVNLAAASLPGIIGSLQERAKTLVSGLFRPSPATQLVPVGSTFLSQEMLTAPSQVTMLPTEISWPYETFWAGVTDLELVRQEIKSYLSGEIAHIENVLQGESKQRTHRRTHRTEEEFLTERETTEETERDLQSTDRLELEAESTKTQKEESKFEAGVTVKYGGFVDVEASTKYETTDASEQSTRTASKYAREITDRTVSKIRERVRELRTRKLIEETEETNLHSINNSLGKDHVVGIYRWVDKLYDAQILNYGKRVMYEFIIPEPAIFVLYARAAKPLTSVPKPQEPMYGPLDMWMDDPDEVPLSGMDLLKAQIIAPIPLQPTHIRFWNFQQYVAQYRVTDVEPKPPRHIVKSWVFESPNRPKALKEENGKNEYTVTHDSKVDVVAIPAGYVAKRAEIVVSTDSVRAAERDMYTGSLDTATGKWDTPPGGGPSTELDYTRVDITVGSQGLPGHGSVERRSFYAKKESIAILQYPDAVKDVVMAASTYDYSFFSEYYKDADGKLRKRRKYEITLDNEIEELPITLTARHYGKLNVAVEIWCERAPRRLEEWQHKTYEAIIRAYLNAKSEYEEALAAAGVQAGITISGGNPALNREIERTELKRGALSLLTHKWKHLQGRGAIEEGSLSGSPKDLPKMINVGELETQAPVIQFLEQAFEWEHIVYTFYPYFWARSDRWQLLQQLDDPDPQHAAFLRAGAARVLVPVRPGYEASVWYYVHFGKPWKGKSSFSVGGDTFIPYIEEAKAQLGFDFDVGPGRISVTDGSDVVTGVMEGNGFTTIFSDEDRDKELLIEGRRYRILEVDDIKQVVTLGGPYRSKPPKAANSVPSGGQGDGNQPKDTSAQEVGYWISQYKLVGEPWEVKIPTSLVYLQQENVKLPTFE